MKYHPPKMDVIILLSKENISLVTSSMNLLDQMDALWSDGFNKT